MLERLLAEIQSGGTLQPTTLANRLGTSPAMVDMMIEELKRRGFLSEVDLACAQTCGGCPIQNTCISKGDLGRLWQVTPKAR